MKNIKFITIVLSLLIMQNVYASRDFLVNSEWLSDRIDDENLVVLEIRYHPHRYNTIGHIPGAVQVQRFKDLGSNFESPLMRFPSKGDFEKTLRKWGVNNDSTIVLYDDSGTALTGRLYYLLELYGFNMKQVKILNGGVRDWMGFEELTKEKETPKKGTVTLNRSNKDIFVEWTDVYDDVVSSRKENVILLDARPNDMYTGKVVKHSILAGHIPGAINIVSMKGIKSQYWIPEKKLQKLYSSISKEKTIYVYCHDGFRMSLAYLQLKSLGYKNVKVYNGGWSHWGNRLTLPTVEGDKPYAGDYDL